MCSLRKYPYRKVMVFFSLTPVLYAVLGLLAVLYSELLSVINGKEFDFYYFFILPLVAGLMAAVVGVVLFFPVTITAGFICSLLKLKKNALGLFVSFWLGGIGAFLWWVFIYPDRKCNYFDSIFYYAKTIDGMSVFLKGAVFLIIVSFLVFPKEVSADMGKFNN